MELWFLLKPDMLHREREAFGKLEKEATWLRAIDWTLEDQKLCVNIAIVVSNVDYKAKLVYPEHFPDAPPTVLPIEPKRRWSTHQYGETGSLCLEWGPDNWISSVTGAQMVNSLYKLLSTENPIDRDQNDQDIIVAPSRHFLEIGQQMRGRYCRFLITEFLQEYLKHSVDASLKEMKYSLNWLPDSLVVMLHEVGIADDSPWSDASVPLNLNGRNDANDLKKGLFFSSPYFTGETLKTIGTFDKLSDVIISAGFDEQNIKNELNDLIENNKVAGICLAGNGNTIGFFLSFDGKKVYSFYSFFDTNFLLTGISQDIASKKVAIIGLGSIGSKIADTLVRSGVKRFLLVDYDIFLPHNVNRHVLNWEDVGGHKTKTVKRLLEKLFKDIKVETNELNLTGQESNLNVGACLTKIVQCDLIIDATANERVFNLLSSIVKREKKPFLWAGTFEGGKGGLIARYLPDKDPLPEIIRAAFNQFCIDNPFPESKTSLQYATEDENGKIMVASDTDVSIIAYNLARLGLDCLSQNYEYKYQVYLIGLGRWWVFNCPLEIIPIDCSAWKSHKPAIKNGNQLSEDDKNFLQKLIEKNK